MSANPPALVEFTERRTRRLRRARPAAAIVALLVIALAWFQVLSAQRGLVSRRLVGEGGIPLLFLAPEGADHVPDVIVAHGFSGSSQLMLGFGHALARAGYGVMLLDFAGHGAAPSAPAEPDGGRRRDLDTAYLNLVAQPEIDPARIALLGHSMGSGAVMTAAIEQPERYRATVAVSPTGARVTVHRPRNLLLMAGALEPRFYANAESLLDAAGGANEDTRSGAGRALARIPTVEHITILFSRVAYQTALDWLNQVFELPAATAAPDRRIVWYAAHLGGWLLLLLAVTPSIRREAGAPARVRRPWNWAGLPLGVLVAVGVVAGLGRAADVSRLGGLLVGGAIGLWFAIMGVVWLLSGFRVSRPTAGDVMPGLALFAVLTLAFGIMAHFVWVPWLLIPARLARWPLLAAASLPWLLATGCAQQGAGLTRRAGWWLYQSAVIVLGLGLSAVLGSELSFIVLLMPVIPIIVAVMSIAGAAFDRPWSFGIGNALFFGWLLVAVFPLA